MESQIEDASRRAEPKPALPADTREAARKRQGLELSRRRVLQEMETTRFAARRTSLEQALAFLDEELKKLGA